MPFDHAAFCADLRRAVDRYVESIDAWERAYRQKYRLVVAGQVSADLQPLQDEFLKAKRELEALVPQATRLCRRYHLREPWPMVMRVELGVNAPQNATWTSALGNGERTLLTKCLLDLEEKSIEEEPPAKTGLLSRILDWFV